MKSPTATTSENLNQPAPSIIQDREFLQFQWSVQDPFLFCVHHLDYYPKSAGNYGPAVEELRGRNIGSDFEGKDGWRMYHGNPIPGFPCHPHRGFETVTVVEQGYIDHADSMGAAGRYANGDLQWMTAGSGVQHSEMFPLLDKNHKENGSIDNTVELFQIWMNLPARNKMTTPHFAMHWNENIPKITKTDESGKKTLIKLYAGEYENRRALPPPPDSWASDPNNHVWIWVLEMEEGAEFTIPAVEEGINRNLYFYQGEKASIYQGLSEKESLDPQHRHGLMSSVPVTLRAESPSKFLLLQGRPINEPVVQYGPFVMNSPEEIQQTFSDFRRTEFGGWNWERRDMVHSHKGRFALHADGREEEPPTK